MLIERVSEVRRGSQNTLRRIDMDGKDRNSLLNYTLFACIILQFGFSSGLEIQNCPSHDILQRLLPHHDYAKVEWIEPDSLDPDATRERTSGHMSPHFFRRGDHQIRYTFTDGISTRECTFIVVILGPNEVDVIPPTVQCPNDQIAHVSSATESAVARWDQPLISDDSGSAEFVNQTSSSGSKFPFGFTPVFITVKDAGNLTASCSFTVKVGLMGDVTPPTIKNCPTDISHKAEIGGSDTVYWVEPSAQDDVGIQRLLFQSHKPGDTFDGGKTKVKYFFEDSSGNKANCSFTVTVEVDQSGPKVQNCPVEVRQSVPPGQLYVNVWWPEPSATDESTVVPMREQTSRPGDEFGVGVKNVSYEFVDSAGNMAFCTFQVWVSFGDMIPPVVHGCPDNTIKEVPYGTESASASWIPPHATDDSGTVIFMNSSHSPASSFNLGITAVEYWFGDLSQNVASCAFTIEVKYVDTTPPLINYCPPDFAVMLPANEWPVFWGTPTASDNSGEVRLLSVSQDSGSRISEGNTTVEYSFADLEGNKASCVFTINATISGSDDLTEKAHVVDCPDTVTVIIPTHLSETAVSWKEPTVEQPKAEIQFNLTQTQRSGDLFSMGTTNVEYIWHGTSLKCEFLVQVFSSGADEEDGSVSEDNSTSSQIPLYIMGGIGGFVIFVLIVMVLGLYCNRRNTPDKDNGLDDGNSDGISTITDQPDDTFDTFSTTSTFQYVSQRVNNGNNIQDNSQPRNNDGYIGDIPDDRASHTYELARVN